MERVDDSANEEYSYENDREDRDIEDRECENDWDAV
jgi:hypothetical protein